MFDRCACRRPLLQALGLSLISQTSRNGDWSLDGRPARECREGSPSIEDSGHQRLRTSKSFKTHPSSSARRQYAHYNLFVFFRWCSMATTCPECRSCSANPTVSILTSVFSIPEGVWNLIFCRSNYRNTMLCCCSMVGLK